MSALCCGRFTPERSESHPARVYGAVSGDRLWRQVSRHWICMQVEYTHSGDIDHIRGTRV